MGLLKLESSSINFAANLTSKIVPAGLFTAPGVPNCWTIFTRAIRSCDLIWYNSPMA